MSKLSPVSVRVSPPERELLEAAAEHSRTNLSDFIRRKAVEAAELDLLDRHTVTIPAADWDRFQAWADAPAKDVPGLRELAETPVPWRK